jgi:aspartyl-tRNA(Asn)/glutamyl-tRNA(Gln) amidotransferase subunit A
MSNKTITQLRSDLDTKKISAVELVTEYNARIKARNPDINAYVTVTEDIALHNARAAQMRIDNGNSAPLTGIPASLKDLICTDGIRTTCASKMLENFTPPYNATVAEKLNAEDYTLLGKVSMDEFAMGGSTQNAALPDTKTRNPVDTTRVPGGSSGGSAAAVAAQLCVFSLGSDTGGSIRQPSSFCGVTGLKPTYGAVSRYGLIAFGSSLDQIGPIANTAEDCGIVMNVISGYDKRDGTSANIKYPDYTAKIGTGVSGLRIALPREFYGEGISPKVADIVTAAAKQLEKNGAVLVDCEMPALKYAVPAYYLISSAEAASNLSRFDGIKYGFRASGKTYSDVIINSRNQGFGDEVKRRILLGNYALSSGYYDAYYRKALALRQIIRQQYADIFANADVILTPTAPDIAYKIGSQESDPVKMYLADICTVTANIAGLPSISTTAGYIDSDGIALPVGMSLTGTRFDEPTIIGVADYYEKLQR